MTPQATSAPLPGASEKRRPLARGLRKGFPLQKDVSICAYVFAMSTSGPMILAIGGPMRVAIGTQEERRRSAGGARPDRGPIAGGSREDRALIADRSRPDRGTQAPLCFPFAAQARLSTGFTLGIRSH